MGDTIFGRAVAGLETGLRAADAAPGGSAGVQLDVAVARDLLWLLTGRTAVSPPRPSGELVDGIDPSYGDPSPGDPGEG